MSSEPCPACLVPVPESDALFCPTCGFRLAPISVEEHRRLSGEFRALEANGGKIKEPVRVEERDQGDEPPADEAPPGGDSERRGAKRFPLRVDVDYSSDHNFYTGFLDNISSGGLFVATHTPATIGEELEVQFTVAGFERRVTAVCQVRWTRDHNPDFPEFPAGFGCRFLHLDPEVRAAVELFIRHREPIFYD